MCSTSVVEPSYWSRNPYGGPGRDEWPVNEIRTTCPTCGDVTIAAQRIYLRLRRGARESEFWFTCPGCATAVTKPASADTTALLLSAGAERLAVDADASPSDVEICVADRSPDPSAPPLTYDDLIDFHFGLADTVTLADLYVASH